jgi:adenylate cyclase
MVAIVAVAVVIAIGVANQFFPGPPMEETASVERMAFPLPDKPSIAVLPFTNMSGDTEQEYFVDGMTENLITDLSKISGLFVIARNSSFSYKGQQVKNRQVARELGVRYVMEGSVQRAGDQVRINAQLIDATTGGHLWAERYDGNLSDVFGLQDKVVGHIVSALKITLTDMEQVQLARIPTNNLEAYDYYLRAERSFYVWGSDGKREALKLYQKAIALDPSFADAYAGIARVALNVWRWSINSVLPGPVARDIAYQAASEALKLDPGNAHAYSVLAYLQVADREYDEALESIEKAVSLHPNDAEVYTNLAGVLVYAGLPVEALSAMDTAFRLEPRPSPIFHADLGWVLFWNRQYEKAIGPLEKGLEGGVEYWEVLAMAYAKLGRLEEAKAMVEKIRQEFPGVNLAYFRASSNFKRAEDLEFRLDALGEAGIPEWPLGYEVPSGDPLDSAAITALTFGRTWVGKDLTNGGPFVQEIGRDGKVGFRGGGALVIGTAWVNNGMLCVDIPISVMTRNLCGYLYRNPEGTSEDQNEYIQVNASNVLTFSTRP